MSTEKNEPAPRPMMAWATTTSAIDGANASTTRPTAMIAPATATNGRRLPNRSDRMPPIGLEITMPTTDANVGREDDAGGLLLGQLELADEVERQERRDARVAEHHHELGQPGPAEVRVLARVEDERAEELPDGEPLRGRLVQAAVAQHGGEQQREEQAEGGRDDEPRDVGGDQVDEDAAAAGCRAASPCRRCRTPCRGARPAPGRGWSRWRRRARR